MRIARVIGSVTLSRRLPDLPPASLLIAEVLDDVALEGWRNRRRRSKPMPESLVVYDQLGAGVGQLIAVSEGREAAQPFGKTRVPVDAYCAAIIDSMEFAR